MAEQYRYSTSVGATSIRLVELQPGHMDDVVNVQISTTDLSEVPPYEALSYEWGEAEKTKSIYSAGKEIAVTSRLLVALKQLRDQDRSRTLWIDAICINQDDTSEKNEQVPLMRDIFTRAGRVLIWLGVEGHRASDCFCMLSTLARFWVAREVKKAHQGELRPLSWDKLDEEEAKSLALEDRPLWDAMYEIFERSYFSRIWVIQEVAVASSPRVLCGGLDISWSRFSWAAAYVSRSRYHLHRSPTEKGLARIAMIMTVRNAYQNNHPFHIFHACTFSQGSKATDERDKVFGLLGLLTRNASTAFLDQLLEVDYRLPVQTVYSRAAQRSILEHQDLRICHCQPFTPKHIKNLPSWAPDWSTLSDGSPTIVLRPQHRMHVSKGKKITFTSNAMHVDGSVIDTICGVTSELSCEDPLPDIQKIMIFLSYDQEAAQMPGDEESKLNAQDLEQVITRLKCRIYQGEESRYEALWRTLIANTADFVIAHPDFRRHFDAVVDSLRLRARGVFWQSTIVGGETSMDKMSRRRLRDDVEAQLLCQRIRANESHPYFRELVNTIACRKFFVTRKGFMGVGSPGAMVGDQVAILHGGWSPFILRQRRSFFELKGDAYLHGIREAKSYLSFKAGAQRMEIH